MNLKYLMSFIVGLFLWSGCGGDGIHESQATNKQEYAECSKCQDCPQCSVSPKPLSNLAVVQTKARFPIVIDARDDCIAKFLAKTGVWEEGVSIALSKLVKAGDHILELGANYGYHTISLSKIVGNLGSIYSYEANPNVCDILQKNKALNNLENLTIECIAVSNKTGKVSFTVDYANLGGSFVNTNDASGDAMLKLKNFKNSETFIVNADSLDSNLALSKQNFNLLRMDIEGSEVLAIQGAANIFKNSPHMRIVMEWSIQQLEKFGSVSEMLKDLEQKGYHYYYAIQEDGSFVEKTYEELLNTGDCDIVITKERMR